MAVKSAVSVTIGAELGGSFKGSFGTAQKQLGKLGGAIKTLDRTSSKITSFKSLKSDTIKTKQAWGIAETKVKELARAINKTDKPSRTMQANFRRAKKEALITKQAFLQNKNAIRQMRGELSKANIDTRNLTKSQSKLGKSLETLRKRQAGLQRNQTAKANNLSRRANYRGQMMDGVALGGALYGMVKPAEDFQYAMAKVGAITNEAENSDGFKKMSAQARELGKTTQYKANEAAEAMQYLGMAGMNTQQILKATPSVLNLAIAGNMDLGRTADITSNILTGFNLEAERTGEVSDVLAQASRSTNVNVEMLGQTMKFVAPAAAAVGGTLQETAALAGVLGDAGIQGTMAGSMLRNSYLRLAAPASAGAKALGKMRDEMGISADEMPDVAKQSLLAQNRLKGLGVAIFDSKGKMKSMIDIMKDMSGALKDASDEEKISTIKDIFGTRSSSGAMAIFKSIETGCLDEVIDKMNSADGSAKQMADRMKATFRGAKKEFFSAVESISISIGSKLLPAFTSVIKKASVIAQKISDFADKHPRLTKYIGLAVAGLISFKLATIGLGYGFTFIASPILTLIGGVRKFRTALSFAKIGMSAIGGIIPKLILGFRALALAVISNPIGLIIAGIAGRAFLVIKYWKPISKFFKSLFGEVCNVFKNLFEWIGKLWDKSKTIFKGFKEWAKDSWIGKVWGWLSSGNDKTQTSSNKTNIGSTISDSSIYSELPYSSPDNIGELKYTPMMSAGASSSVVNAPITINASNGMSSEDIALAVSSELDNREQQSQRRMRGVNYD